MGRYRKILLCGLGAFAIGLLAWVYQGMVGLGLTNLSNAFPWGHYVACFEFFAGVGAGGLLVFSLAYVLKKDYLKPLAPIAAVIALAGAVGAIFAILSDMGMALRLYRVLLTPNFASPLLWDIVIVSIFFVVAVLAVIFQLREKENARDRCKKLAYVALPVSILMGIVTALLFATQRSHEWWNSAIFPIDSTVATFALGGSVALLFALLYFGKKKMLENEKAYTLIGRIVVVCLAAHLLMMLLQLLPFIGSKAPANQELFALLFGKYGGLYVLEILFSIGAIAIYWTKKYANQFWVNLGACVCVIFGGFIHRLMVLYPAFNTHELTLDYSGNLWSVPIAVGTYTEGSPSFVDYWGYVPSVVELTLTLLPIGACLILVGLLFSKIHEGGHKAL